MTWQEKNYRLCENYLGLIKRSAYEEGFRNTLTRFLYSPHKALTVKSRKQLPPNAHNKSEKPDAAWTVSDPNMKYSRIV